MRFVLFTDKTISQCVTTIHDRIQAPATSSRIGLQGHVEKSGKFTIAMTAPVVGRLTRTTRMDAHMERESGLTVIRGNVPDGAGPRGQAAVLIGIVLIALMLGFLQGQLILGLLTLAAGGVIYIPLRGDFENSDKLLMEVERTLKASPKPPKPSVTKTGATALQKKPVGAVKPSSAAKPSSAGIKAASAASKNGSKAPAKTAPAKKPAPSPAASVLKKPTPSTSFSGAAKRS